MDMVAPFANETTAGFSKFLVNINEYIKYSEDNLFAFQLVFRL
jgi:hypothetical protein